MEFGTGRMDRSLFTARFKRDYVAFSAVAIFFLIVLSEIALAISIPAYFVRSNLWALQIQRQNLLSDFDRMRHTTASAKIRDNGAEEENKLIFWTLNMMANYLRVNRQTISAERTGELAKDLAALGRIGARLRQNQPYNQELKLDTAPYLRAAAGRLAAPSQQEHAQ